MNKIIQSSVLSDRFSLIESISLDLKRIQWVPREEYLLSEGKVFVFNKLAELVFEDLQENHSTDLETTARKNLEGAFISAEEAAHDYGIIPEPYSFFEDEKGFRIQHDPFEALLPGCFENEKEVRSVFARLLSGQIQPGEGDFTYKGQPMLLPKKFDPNLLPTKPVAYVPATAKSKEEGQLQKIQFQEGFDPISKRVFEKVKNLEDEWARQVSYVQEEVVEYLTFLWTKIPSLIEYMDYQKRTLDDAQKEQEEKLRTFYPELDSLSDGSLFYLFEAYCEAEFFTNSWSAYQDPRFLFFVLGKIAQKKAQNKGHLSNGRSLYIGEWTAHFMIHSVEIQEALNLGICAALYDIELYKLSWRISRVFQFFVSDAHNNKQVAKSRHHMTFSEIFNIN